MAKRRIAFRSIVLCLAGAVSGCSWFESLGAAFRDEPAPARDGAPVLAAGVAAAPTFRVGDVFHFRMGEALVSETVEKIDANGVWWRDSLGRQRVGSEPLLVPARPVIGRGGAAEIANVAMQATGDVFPLTPGKTVAFRYTMPGGFYTAETHEQSCTAVAPRQAETAAGTFDAWLLECVYDGVRRNNYYAPALGRVVLQKADTILASVKRELVGFERGPADPPRTAGTTPATSGDSTDLAPTSYGDGGGPFGVQVAAYRSPDRARTAWQQLRRRSGGLLEGIEPTYEQREIGGVPLFRVIVGNYPSRKEARDYCRALKRTGIDCWARARMAGGAPPRVAAADSGADPRRRQR